MIYCVEDDNSIRELMIYTLQASGFEACGFRDGDSFWEMLKDKKPEPVILDIMLPGEDGISILKKLRLSPTTEDIPVIMATAKNSEYDTVIGLDSGADDYLAKPFGMMEMVSRIKAVLRRSNPGNKAGEIRCGSIVIDEGKHTVKVDGKPVSLTLKEYELLKLMMENAGHVFTRDGNLKSAKKTESLEHIVDEMKERLRTRHILRLQRGECSVDAGFVWADLLTNLERVADHCSNISGCVLDTRGHTMNIHHNQRLIRTDGEEYEQEIKELRVKYNID